MPSKSGFTGTIKCSTCHSSCKVSQATSEQIIKWLQEHRPATHTPF